jgi:hypothetical protein
MKDIYDYQANITLTKTPNGDFVITMNDAILTALINHIDDASEFQRSKGYGATADDTKELWRALSEKHNKED